MPIYVLIVQLYSEIYIVNFHHSKPIRPDLFTGRQPCYRAPALYAYRLAVVVVVVIIVIKKLGNVTGHIFAQTTHVALSPPKLSCGWGPKRRQP